MPPTPTKLLEPMWGTAFIDDEPRISNVAYWRPKKTSLMPHLPLAETSFESPLAGSETAEQQQESCPTCLPSAAPRISNVAYWRPKKTSLMPHLPLAETSFESPLAGSETAEQQQDSCPTCLPSAAPLTLRTDALKKQVLCHTYPLQKPALRVHWLVPKQPNSSRNRAQHAVPAQRPESLTLRTDALKKQVLCHTYPLQKPALRVHWLVPKQPNSSRNRAQHAFPAQRPESLTLRTDALKKQSFCHTYPLQKPALRVHWLVPKQPNSSRNRAQHAFPAQRPESLTLRTDALKKQVLCHTYPLQEPALRVHFGWVLCHTYPLQEPTLRVHFGWFRNSRTAAGIVPNMPNGTESCKWHQPVCHLVPCALADSSGALPLCDAGVGGYMSLFFSWINRELLSRSEECLACWAWRCISIAAHHCMPNLGCLQKGWSYPLKVGKEHVTNGHCFWKTSWLKG